MARVRAAGQRQRAGGVVDVGARHHRHVPGRLLRHPHGPHGDRVPVQRHRRPHVLRLDVQLPRQRPAVRQARRPPADRLGLPRLPGRAQLREPVHRRHLRQEGEGACCYCCGQGRGQEGTVRAQSVMVRSSEGEWWGGQFLHHIQKSINFMIIE